MEKTLGAEATLTIPYNGFRIAKPWRLDTEIRYYSSRYDKWVVVPVGYESDGATGAIDIKGSDAWWVHDWLCDTGIWNDGTPVTNWQASRVVTDKLNQDEYDFRRWAWFWPTWVFGGGKCRDNGMW